MKLAALTLPCAGRGPLFKRDAGEGGGIAAWPERDLPPPMKEAIEQFRSELGAAIDSVEFVKRALDREVDETEKRSSLPHASNVIGRRRS